MQAKLAGSWILKGFFLRGGYVADKYIYRYYITELKFKPLL